MSKKWIRIAVVAMLILLPVIVHAAYRKWTALPGKITVATGPYSGLYQQVTEDLAHQIQERFPNLDVVTLDTNGSLKNLLLLQSGEADFAMYQPGTLELVKGTDHTKAETVAFVANLYPQLAHWIVRQGAGIKNPEDMRTKRVAVGLRESGDYAMSLMLLDHFALDEEAIDAKHIGYEQVKQGFEDGTLDEVTFLRQGALGELTAHELNEDRAAVCFIQMCHALSNKINAKISRQRLDQRIDLLTETLSELIAKNPAQGTDGNG